MILCRLKFGRNFTALCNYDGIFNKNQINRQLGSFSVSNCHTRQLSNYYSTNSKVSSTVGQSKQKKPKLIVKTAKGTCDFGPQQMALRQSVFKKIESIFQTHGAQAIDTPVFELKELLTGQYGDDSKLIYDLADQGGEILALRYDLTVPLARYVAMNKISSIKRYHIAKVYRRDEPSIVRGRYREFYQCDFDIAGSYDSMIADAECVKVVSEILNTLDIGEFVIKLNHRQLLDGIFEACGVPADKFRTICSTVDKLDKSPWADVRRELIDEKGLNEVVADKIGEYVQLSGNLELVEKLLKDEQLSKVPSAVAGLEATKLLLNYCNLLGLEKEIVFDLSLARGLDYYTGVIYEAVLKAEPPSVKVEPGAEERVGSIAGGGRYDNLVGMFDPKKKSVPCVGVSIGIERILSILEAKNAKENTNISNGTDVVVISAHKGLEEQRLKLVNRLWNAKIRTEHSYKRNPKFLHQIEYCEKNNVPLAIIIGDDELGRNVVKFRIIKTREEIEVPFNKIEDEIRSRLDSKLDSNE